MHTRRWILVGTIAILIGVAAIWLVLRSSLPQLRGEVDVAGLAATVAIDRDALGVPTITGDSREDVAYATGFVHAQDRFFQMDLLRRTAAGELAELLGADALDVDQHNRLHRFRTRAHAAFAALPADQRQLLEHYANGVNAGLASLSGRPFEYWLLNAKPILWRPEDSLLVVDAMYLQLQQGVIADTLARSVLRESQPPDMLAFLLPNESHWDAPLNRDANPRPVTPAPLPAIRPNWLGPAPIGEHASLGSSAVPGSNNWAVDGTHSTRGAALVANDMHLSLRLPNTWYRLSIVYPDPHGQTRCITGVSLPGGPIVVAGSNGRVAWGFTSHDDTGMDLIELQRDPADSTRYRVPGGEWEKAARYHERIAVKGRDPVDDPVLETRWGPILSIGRRSYAIRWVAHDPHGADMTLVYMEGADNVAAALKVGQSSGMPNQNLIVGDSAGHIGWTMAGPIPRRVIANKGFPIPAADYRPWQGYLKPEEYPAIIDPPQGRLWTANNRQLDGPEQAKMGDAFANLGARATQIRDDLFAHERFDEKSMLAIQLDDRALWIEFWRHLMLDSLDAQALIGQPDRAELKQLVEHWNGKADIDSAGYLLVRDFYESLYQSWFGQLDGQLDTELRRSFRGLGYHNASSRAGAVMETLAQQHAWIPAQFHDWRSFMLDRVDETLRKVKETGRSLNEVRWGDANRVAIAHPLAAAIPVLDRWLTAPPDPLPGDTVNMPLIEGPMFGASERMVVAPGHEESGFFHMPGGQSGNPLSPFFLAGHQAWVHGEATSFLPGPSRYRLVLKPAAALLNNSNKSLRANPNVRVSYSR
ncbi:MAG TPA: penicillin acylase family protein [Rhodocyclaceae bacterium]|nr:penicillin acylase family protein [Rhodocyclaceae bacterium]